MSKPISLVKNQYLVTAACAAFLVNKHISPRHVSALISRAEDTASFRNMLRRLRNKKESRCVTVQIWRDGPAYALRGMYRRVMVSSLARLRKKSNDQRAFLKFLGKDYHYVECINGYAELVVFAPPLPETICAALGGGHLSLSSVLDHKGFFTAGDPKVLSVKNCIRSKRKALLLRWKLEFIEYSGRQLFT